MVSCLRSPGVGIEPTTTRLKAERSTAELTGINNLINNQIVLKSLSILLISGVGLEPTTIRLRAARSTSHVVTNLTVIV